MKTHFAKHPLSQHLFLFVRETNNTLLHRQLRGAIAYTKIKKKLHEVKKTHFTEICTDHPENINKSHR